MYSIGFGYIAGKHNLEKACYVLAAAEEVPAAYLALGNIYRESDLAQAIAWYIRFVIKNRRIWLRRIYVGRHLLKAKAARKG